MSLFSQICEEQLFSRRTSRVRFLTSARKLTGRLIRNLLFCVKVVVARLLLEAYSRHQSVFICEAVNFPSWLFAFYGLCYLTPFLDCAFKRLPFTYVSSCNFWQASTLFESGSIISISRNFSRCFLMRLLLYISRFVKRGNWRRRAPQWACTRHISFADRTLAAPGREPVHLSRRCATG